MTAIESLCDRIPELIFQLEQGLLSPGRAAAVERHLRECARCRSLLADFQRTRAVVRDLAGELASRAPTARAHREPHPSWRWLGRLLAAAAALAAIWMIFRLISPPRPTGATAAVPPALSPAAGGPGPSPGVAQAKVVRSEPVGWTDEELAPVRAGLAAGTYDRRFDPLDGAERDLQWLLPPGKRRNYGEVRVVYLTARRSVVEFPRRDGAAALRLTLEPLLEHRGRPLWFTVLIEEIEIGAREGRPSR